jgi:NADH-quinone oxidoreductase subunit J
VLDLPPTLLTRCLLICLAGGLGTFLMMPTRRHFARPALVFAIGLGLVAFAALNLVFLGSGPEPIVSRLFFNVFALASVLGGVLMITARDPVHSALWFAVVVLSTSGLFMMAGAGFLAAGTVIVYAGAIIVTFLFVIMLAQSGGQAVYDRLARQPAQASLTGFILIWSMLVVILSDPNYSMSLEGSVEPVVVNSRLIPASELVSIRKLRSDHPGSIVLSKTLTPELTIPEIVVGEMPPGIPAPHVAGLGAALYTTHLISAELVGAILFVALAGAVVIATPRVAGKSL